MKTPRKQHPLIGQVVRYTYATPATSCQSSRRRTIEGKVTRIRHNPTPQFGRNTLVVVSESEGSNYVSEHEVTHIKVGDKWVVKKQKPQIKKIKPRRMWANVYPDYTATHPTKTCALCEHGEDATHIAVPVVVIPLDDVEGLMEKAINGYVWGARGHEGGVRSALRAIGIPVKKEGNK